MQKGGKLTKTALLDCFLTPVSTKRSCLLLDSLSDGGFSGCRSGKPNEVGLGIGLSTSRVVLNQRFDVARPFFVQVRWDVLTLTVVLVGVALIEETFRATTSLGIGGDEVRDKGMKRETKRDDRDQDEVAGLARTTTTFRNGRTISASAGTRILSIISDLSGAPHSFSDPPFSDHWDRFPLWSFYSLS
jgi:hypothetical protein